MIARMKLFAIYLGLALAGGVLCVRRIYQSFSTTNYQPRVDKLEFRYNVTFDFRPDPDDLMAEDETDSEGIDLALYGEQPSPQPGGDDD